MSFLHGGREVTVVISRPDRGEPGVCVRVVYGAVRHTVPARKQVTRGGRGGVKGRAWSERQRTVSVVVVVGGGRGGGV